MIKPRVKETSITSGLSNLSLLGPVAGFRSFVNAFGTGGLCYYAIIDGTAWEYGIGTVTSGAPDTLARTTVLDSSAAGAKLSLSAGTKLVFNDAMPALVPIQTQSASNSAQIDFTSGFTSLHDRYLVMIANMVLATNGAELWMRVTQDGGATFKAGATDYSHALLGITKAGTGSAGSAADSKMVVSGANRNTNAASDVLHGTLTLFSPSGTTNNKWCMGDLIAMSTIPDIGRSLTFGVFQLNTSAINGIRLFTSSGNISSGTFTLYGVRK